MAGQPWFQPKPGGHGVTPATWQGWVVMFGAVIALLATVFVLIARLARFGS